MCGLFKRKPKAEMSVPSAGLRRKTANVDSVSQSSSGRAHGAVAPVPTTQRPVKEPRTPPPPREPFNAATGRQSPKSTRRPPTGPSQNSSESVNEPEVAPKVTPPPQPTKVPYGKSSSQSPTLNPAPSLPHAPQSPKIDKWDPIPFYGSVRSETVSKSSVSLSAPRSSAPGETLLLNSGAPSSGAHRSQNAVSENDRLSPGSSYRPTQARGESPFVQPSAANTHAPPNNFNQPKPELDDIYNPTSSGDGDLKSGIRTKTYEQVFRDLVDKQEPCITAVTTLLQWLIGTHDSRNHASDIIGAINENIKITNERLRAEGKKSHNRFTLNMLLANFKDIVIYNENTGCLSFSDPSIMDYLENCDEPLPGINVTFGAKECRNAISLHFLKFLQSEKSIRIPAKVIEDLYSRRHAARSAGSSVLYDDKKTFASYCAYVWANWTQQLEHSTMESVEVSKSLESVLGEGGHPSQTFQRIMDFMFLTKNEAGVVSYSDYTWCPINPMSPTQKKSGLHWNPGMLKTTDNEWSPILFAAAFGFSKYIKSIDTRKRLLQKYYNMEGTNIVYLCFTSIKSLRSRHEEQTGLTHRNDTISILPLQTLAKHPSFRFRETDIRDILLFLLKEYKGDPGHTVEFMRFIFQAYELLNSNPYPTLRWAYDLMYLKGFSPEMPDQSCFPTEISGENGSQLSVSYSDAKSFIFNQTTPLAEDSQFLTFSRNSQELFLHGVPPILVLFIGVGLGYTVQKTDSNALIDIDPGLHYREAWGDCINFMVLADEYLRCGSPGPQKSYIVTFEHITRSCIGSARSKHRMKNSLNVKANRLGQNALEYACNHSHQVNDGFLRTLVETGVPKTAYAAVNAYASKHKLAMKLLQDASFDVERKAQECLLDFKKAVTNGSKHEVVRMIKEGFPFRLVLSEMDEYKQELLNLSQDSAKEIVRLLLGKWSRMAEKREADMKKAVESAVLGVRAFADESRERRNALLSEFHELRQKKSLNGSKR